MIHILSLFSNIVAQAGTTTDQTSTTGGGGGFLGGGSLTLIIYVVIFIAIFYFLLIRPGQRQRKAHSQLVSGIHKGDEVMTAGGIFGKVTSVKEDYVSVEIAKKTEIRLSRNSIARVISSSEQAALDSEEEEEDVMESYDAGKPEE